ncbi:MAG: hypothetical protein JWO89_2274 [Verrucomicrobiaceae bacterium]|nr:hypothetical protein [Verrucomicrobiaceae bacterium]
MVRSLINELFGLPELKGQRFLLIGGHAVNALGRIRSTLDWDFMIPRSQIPNWTKALAGLGYSIFGTSDVFLQYSEPEGLPPVDLMLVDDSTFDKLYGSSKEVPVGAFILHVPAAAHMVALKLHSAASPFRQERSKDLDDVYAIIKANQLSLDDPDFRTLVEKYGGDSAIRLIELHERNQSGSGPAGA